MKDGRDTGGLLLMSDLIISDGGSSVIEAIYLKKKVLFHHWLNKMNLCDLEERLKDINRIDNIICKKIPSLKKLNNVNKIENFIKDNSILKRINKLRNRYFLSSSNFLASDIIKKYYAI